MRKTSMLLLVLVFALWLNCFADCRCSEPELKFVPCPKTYVRPDQIDIRENAIFVQVHDYILQAEYLNSDAQGIFFEKVTADGCGPSKWKCTRTLDNGLVCNTCNWDWNSSCSYCHKDKK